MKIYFTETKIAGHVIPSAWLTAIHDGSWDSLNTKYKYIDHDFLTIAAAAISLASMIDDVIERPTWNEQVDSIISSSIQKKDSALPFLDVDFAVPICIGIGEVESYWLDYRVKPDPRVIHRVIKGTAPPQCEWRIFANTFEEFMHLMKTDVKRRIIHIP